MPSVLHMTVNTINNDMTMGGETGTLLAGRYRVVRQLGQGGMGSVWLAEDTKLDGFKVAIKMLPSVLVNNKRAYAQVKAEALVSLKLSHSNIVAVRAFEEEGGNPFLVMDYIDGQTLDDYLAEKGKLTEEETVRLLKPVAAALDYAHTQGVVHRDVKPGNIMIRKDGTPFVLDFGIAREIQETMTRVTGKLSSGTLLYMSPEQLNGAAPKPVQDVYSFAAMAYECLKGEPPFSRGQVEFQILNNEPEPLPGGSDLARSILRGLAKVPAARPGKCMGVVAPVVISRPHPRPISQRVEVPKEDVRFIPPRDRAMFADSESDSSCSAVRPKDPSRFAPPSYEQRMSNRRRLGMWIALLMLVIAGCAIWFVKFTDHHVFKSKTTNTAIPASVPVPPQTKVDAVNVRAEALLQIAVCRKIDRSDGFNAKIEECENTITRGRLAFDREDWSEAVKSYNEAIRQCGLVIEMSKDRDRAREAANAMEKQARAAKEAEAERYAKDRFDAAKELIVEAKKAFAEMQFAVAAEKHELAARQFDLSAGEAKVERFRQEETAKKVADERKMAAARSKIETRSLGYSFVIGPDGGVNLEMRFCPSGEYTAGASARYKQKRLAFHQFMEDAHKVRMEYGFWTSAMEISQKQWQMIMKDTGMPLTVDRLKAKIDEDKRKLFAKGSKTLKEVYETEKAVNMNLLCGEYDAESPVYFVSWEDAVAFCERLTYIESQAGHSVPDGYVYRLPTEKEWEYACRGTSQADIPGMGDFEVTDKWYECPNLEPVAWHMGNAHKGYTGIGKSFLSGAGNAFVRKRGLKSPNEFGIYDILGNVAEWCIDDRESGRPVRGGCWSHGPFMSVPFQPNGYWPAGFRANFIGFRIVLAPVLNAGLQEETEVGRKEKIESYRKKHYPELYTAGFSEKRMVSSGQKTVLLPNDVPIEMVWCGPSVFEVSPGVSQERKGFWIAKYELTQRQWKSVMRDNPSEFQNDTLPVENLSWNDCSRFLSALRARSSYKFRMPFGYEWEYAARGGPKGEMLMPPDDFAWWGRNSGDRTHEGGSKKPNALGLCDVLGNVWEWCAGTGTGENFGKRELRGGSFCNNNQKLLDAKTPMYSEQDAAGRGAGLRLVCDDL